MKEQLITSAQISHMVKAVADQIAHDYTGRQVHMICVLNGALFFAADLMRALPLDCTYSCVQLRSYEGMTSSGRVEEVIPLTTDIRDKDVIVIEDIVDTGTTMHFYKQKLLALAPRSLKVAAMLFKPSQLQYPDAKPDYYGCEIPNKFVIGYGLDMDGLARNLPHIYAVTQSTDE